MSKRLKVIAVDLTPILPGGENGGAKIFVLELLRCLSGIKPETEFILLTQDLSHDELREMERGNVRRVMVVKSPDKDKITARTSIKKIVHHTLSRLPHKVYRVANRVIGQISRSFERKRSGLSLKEMGVDLLFCPFTAPTFYEIGIPTVCTVYDLQYKTYPEFFSEADAIHRENTFREACRHAAMLVAISEYTRCSAIRHGGLDPTSIRTIYLRMARREMSTGRGVVVGLLEQIGVACERYLLYPANFWKHKNHEMLLTAFGIACNKGLPADIKLVCTGAPGHRLEWLKSAAYEMGIGERVLFPGYLSNSELSALITNCLGIVFPSLYEGFGLPVIEAMGAEKPVACSNVASLPEIAGGAALLFDPRVPNQIADAIISLSQDYSRHKHLVEAGKTRAAEFSDTRKMAEEYWLLFTQAISRERESTDFSGVHSDCWIGEKLCIETRASDNNETIELELEAPLSMPHTMVTAIVSGIDGEESKVNIYRGETTRLVIKVENGCSYYEVRFHPTFVPADICDSDDHRIISVKLNYCKVNDTVSKNVLFERSV